MRQLQRLKKRATSSRNGLIDIARAHNDANNSYYHQGGSSASGSGSRANKAQSSSASHTSTTTTSGASLSISVNSELRQAMAERRPQSFAKQDGPRLYKSLKKRLHRWTTEDSVRQAAFGATTTHFLGETMSPATAGNTMGGADAFSPRFATTIASARSTMKMTANVPRVATLTFKRSGRSNNQSSIPSLKEVKHVRLWRLEAISSSLSSSGDRPGTAPVSLAGSSSRSLEEEYVARGYVGTRPSTSSSLSRPSTSSESFDRTSKRLPKPARRRSVLRPPKAVNKIFHT